MPYKCKKEQAKAARKHYLKNKDKIKKRTRESNKKSIIRNRTFLWNYLLKNPCVDCGESDPVVLQFDHVRGKKRFALSDGAKNSYGIETLQKEIDKCEIRCANCHTRKTAKDFNYFSL